MSRPVAEHDAVDDLSVRLVASHRASAARCTVRAEPTADASALRRDGVAVVVLDRGYASGAQEAAPWLLGGVKSTSGAVTRAALREAHAGLEIRLGCGLVSEAFMEVRAAQL